MPQMNGDITPHPDPTRLTTEQLYREILWLRELLEQRIRALEVVVDTRFTERDARFEQIQRLLEERGIRIHTLESQIASFSLRIATVEASRSTWTMMVPWIISFLSIVIGSVLAFHRVQ